MKSIVLIGTVIVSMAVVLASCSGEDGEMGPQGEQGLSGLDGINGTDGADGTNGISCWDLNGNGIGDPNEDINDDSNFDALDCQGNDGANGADGNANVQEYAIDISTEANYTRLDLDLTTIVDTPANYSFLYYIDHNSGLRYSLPGGLSGNTHYARVYVDTQTNQLYVEFYRTSDNTLFVVPQGIYTQLIVVAIELTKTGKTSESIMSDLKSAGVDTSDYNAVADYFGLK